MIETAVLRLCGQRSIGPTGVVDQSNARVRRPISPPPVSQSPPDTRRFEARILPLPRAAGFLRDGLRIALPLDFLEREWITGRLPEPLPQSVHLCLELDHLQLPS